VKYNFQHVLVASMANPVKTQVHLLEIPLLIAASVLVQLDLKDLTAEMLLLAHQDPTHNPA